MNNHYRLLVFCLFTFLIILPACEKNEPPTILTDEIEDITGTTATCGGIITDEGSSAIIARGVCWSEDPDPTVEDYKTSDGTGGGVFSSSLTGLSGATTYHIRAYATNSEGTGYGAVMSFTTLGSLPGTSTLDASDITTTSATLNGTVNANYLSTTVSFEYGTTESYGQAVIVSQSPILGNANADVSAGITDLSPGTTYHFRVKSENSLGTTTGSDMTFTTLGQVPTILTLQANNITSTSAFLIGIVNGNKLSTTVDFDYGTSSYYGNSIMAIQSPISGSSLDTVNVTLSGLSLGTTYHYRIAATNSLGTTYSDEMTFTTEYAFGEYVHGGLVFYIDDSKLHGLVCAPTDQSTGTIWGCMGTIITGADGTSLGTGKQNTIDIINECPTTNIAAQICYDLVLNGYDDWFLPSIDELGLMYTNLCLNEQGHLGDFNGNNYYSSSEYNCDWAWFYNFGNFTHPRCNGGALGEGANKNGYDGTTYNPSHVRAVRAF